MLCTQILTAYAKQIVWQNTEILTMHEVVHIVTNIL